jgi:secretion/DNA translocation related CpaE-like protein
VTTGEVLLLTARDGLGEQVRRLAAAAGVPLHVCRDPEAAGRRWVDAPLVLLGDDAATLGAPVRRPGVVLVAAEDAGERVWRLAVDAGAEDVALLPRNEVWLVERLACAVDGERGRAGLVVGVLGGCGGAGGSVLAAALAGVAADRGVEVLLVDGDPLGGGVDLLLGAEDAPGLRWPDLASARGVVRGAVLRDGLPQGAGVRFLGWDRQQPVDVPAAAMEAVLDAGRHGHDLVVVDLPRRDDPATLAALWRLDVLFLVVPARVQAAAAASRALARVTRHAGDIRLVVRGPSPAGLSATAVADAVGLPLTARCAAEPGLAAALDRGEPPGSRRRGPLARTCRHLLADLLPARAAAQGAA